jgi:hypothetical protein
MSGSPIKNPNKNIITKIVSIKNFFLNNELITADRAKIEVGTKGYREFIHTGVIQEISDSNLMMYSMATSSPTFFIENSLWSKVENFRCSTSFIKYLNYPILTNTNDFAKYSEASQNLKDFPISLKSAYDFAKNNGIEKEEFSKQILVDYSNSYFNAQKLNYFSIYQDKVIAKMFNDQTMVVSTIGALNKHNSSILINNGQIKSFSNSMKILYALNDVATLNSRFLKGEIVIDDAIS